MSITEVEDVGDISLNHSRPSQIFDYAFDGRYRKDFLKYAIAILMGTSILYNELEFGNRRFRARSNLISYGMSAVPRMYLEQAQVLSAEC